MKPNRLLSGHIISLLSGCSIYLLFRHRTLIMFSWADGFGFTNPLLYARQSVTPLKAILPEWLLFALPDGLWLFSYITLMLWLWKNQVGKENLLWLFIIPVLAFCSEIGQAIRCIPGTFDGTDLCMYALGTSLPFIIYKKSLTINL